MKILLLVCKWKMDDAATTKYPAAANETNVKRMNWLRLLLLLEVVCSSSGGGGGGLRIEDRWGGGGDGGC